MDQSLILFLRFEIFKLFLLLFLIRAVLFILVGHDDKIFIVPDQKSLCSAEKRFHYNLHLDLPFEKLIDFKHFLNSTQANFNGFFLFTLC